MLRRVKGVVLKGQGSLSQPVWRRTNLERFFFLLALVGEEGENTSQIPREGRRGEEASGRAEVGEGQQVDQVESNSENNNQDAKNETSTRVEVFAFK